MLGRAARNVLVRRVELASQKRKAHDKKCLSGWLNRTDLIYLDEITAAFDENSEKYLYAKMISSFTKELNYKRLLPCYFNEFL